MDETANDRTTPFSHHENRRSPYINERKVIIGDFEGTQFFH